MRNRQIACFSIWASRACIIPELEDLNAEAVQLAATIKKNFEELEI
jgi:hypothetical protein